MCKKNDYGRKAITVILALLTALLVLAAMSGKADAAQRRENKGVAGDVYKSAIDSSESFFSAY